MKKIFKSVLKYVLTATTVVSMTLCTNNVFCDNSQSTKVQDSNVKDNKVSSDWRDQIIYFIMTDRFADGNTKNDNQGCGEYGHEAKKFNGGDLQGIANKINYIKGLGATTIWITPPVANQWYSGDANSGYGYHGYWAENFMKVDKHFGTLDDYKNLVKKCHDNNMSVIQDIVLNHTGNFFTYPNNQYDATNVKENWTPMTGSVPVKAPTQYPFNENNPNKNLKDAIYHFTPNIENMDNQFQRENYQLYDLDDLNTENPVVVKALKDSYKYWIKEVGIDGFRIDSARHVPKSFLQDFINGKDGIKAYASSLGKNDFFTYGEDFDSSNQNVAGYVKDNTGNIMDSMLDFPLQDTLKRVFINGESTKLISTEFNERTNKLYNDTGKLVTFVDNHDMSRWLSMGSKDSLKEALGVIMTVPGIPAIYYGTEQSFDGTSSDLGRKAMFKDGYGSNNKDHYDTNSEMYQFIKKMTDIRKNNKVFTRGDLKVIYDNNEDAGVFAYKLSYQGQDAVVVFNSDDTTKEVCNIPAGLTKNSKLNLLMTSDQKNKLDNVSTDKDGNFSIKLNGQKFAVFMDQNTENSNLLQSKASAENIKNGDTIKKAFTINGTAKNAEKVSVDIDGKNTVESAVYNDKWSAKLNLSSFHSGTHSIIISSVDMNGNISVSQNINFKLDTGEKPLSGEIADPKGDDRGPNLDYTYPKDSTLNGQLDLLGEKAEVIDGKLRLTLKMKKITDISKSKIGLDHLLMNIFFEDPSKKGCDFLPNANSGSLPDGFCYSYVTCLSPIYLENISVNSDCSSSELTISPKAVIDTKNNTIQITYPKKTFGGNLNYKGWKIYTITWGCTNSLVEYNLEKKATATSFGNGDRYCSFVADATKVLTIK